MPILSERSSIGVLSIRIRSFTFSRWGERLVPTRYPAAVSAELTIMQVLPLPFVPAI